MAHRNIRPVTIVVAASLLTAATGLAACGRSSNGGSSSATTPATPTTPVSATTTPAATSAGTTVPVTLSEYKIKPAAVSAPAGHVVFDVSNDGAIKHQFTIIRTPKPAATVLSKQNPNDDIPGARGEVASLKPGANAKLVIKKLKAGHYALVCALPGHYQSGMFADFTVN